MPRWKVVVSSLPDPTGVTIQTAPNFVPEPVASKVTWSDVSSVTRGSRMPGPYPLLPHFAARRADGERTGRIKVVLVTQVQRGGYGHSSSTKCTSAAGLLVWRLYCQVDHFSLAGGIALRLKYPDYVNT